MTHVTHDQPLMGYWATVQNNGSPYATGPLSCLSVCPVCLSVLLVYCGQTDRQTQQTGKRSRSIGELLLI